MKYEEICIFFKSKPELKQIISFFHKIKNDHSKLEFICKSIKEKYHNFILYIVENNEMIDLNYINQIFKEACINNQLETVKYLYLNYKDKININYDDNSILYFTIKNGHLNIIKWLYMIQPNIISIDRFLDIMWVFPTCYCSKNIELIEWFWNKSHNKISNNNYFMNECLLIVCKLGDKKLLDNLENKVKSFLPFDFENNNKLLSYYDFYELFFSACGTQNIDFLNYFYQRYQKFINLGLEQDGYMISKTKSKFNFKNKYVLYEHFKKEKKIINWCETNLDLDTTIIQMILSQYSYRRREKLNKNNNKTDLNT